MDALMRQWNEHSNEKELTCQIQTQTMLLPVQSRFELFSVILEQLELLKIVLKILVV